MKTTRVPVYECSKCALQFDKPTEFRDPNNHFRWCPCCSSPDIQYVGVAVVGTPLAESITQEPRPDFHDMVIFDILSDGQLDGVFF